MGISLSAADLAKLSADIGATYEDIDVALAFLGTLLESPDIHQVLAIQPLPPRALRPLVQLFLRTSEGEPSEREILEKLLEVLAHHDETNLIACCHDRENVDSNLKIIQLIFWEIPRVKKLYQERDDFELALTLAKWLSHNILLPPPDMVVQPDSLLETLQLGWAGQGGVFCGWTARAYAHLLHLFNLDAIHFNYRSAQRCSAIPGLPGDEGVASHETTIVRCGTDSFHIIDAYINYYYRDQSAGMPLDLATLLDRIKSGDYSSVEKALFPSVRWYLFDTDKYSLGEHSEFYVHAFKREYPNERLGVAVRVPDLFKWDEYYLDPLRGNKSRHQFDLELLLAPSTCSRFRLKSSNDLFSREIKARLPQLSFPD